MLQCSNQQLYSIGCECKSCSVVKPEQFCENEAYQSSYPSSKLHDDVELFIHLL